MEMEKRKSNLFKFTIVITLCLLFISTFFLPGWLWYIIGIISGMLIQYESILIIYKNDPLQIIEQLDEDSNDIY